MLFAQAAQSSDFGHGATVLTVALAALGGLFAWLNARETRLGNLDRFNADSEKQQLKLEVAVHKVREEHCAELKEEVVQLRAAMEKHGIDCPAMHQPPNPAQAGLAPQPK